MLCLNEPNFWLSFVKLLNCVLGMFACFLILGFHLLTCLVCLCACKCSWFTCSNALPAWVLAYLRGLHAHMLSCLSAWHAHGFVCLFIYFLFRYSHFLKLISQLPYIYIVYLQYTYKNRLIQYDISLWEIIIKNFTETIHVSLYTLDFNK